MTCHPCEYDDPDRCPSTVEGWACWSAAEAALRGGEMLVPHVDAAAALALAQAAGVPPVPAAELVMAVQSGMGAGLAKREGRR